MQPHLLSRREILGRLGALAGMLSVAVPVTVRASVRRPTWVFVGTYTGPKSKGIHAFRFHPQTGEAEPPRLVAETPNPAFLDIHPNGRFLYAVGEIGEFQGQRTGAISGFAIDAADARLTPLGQVSSGGSGPCHVSVDRTGKWVAAANYGGGSVAVFPIRADGSLGDAVCVQQHQGSSVNPKRQEGPHAHGVTFDPANRFLLVPDLGLDRILIYQFDAGTGQLTPNRTPFAAVDAGAGPRHLAFLRNGRFAYAVNELENTVTGFRYNARRGGLEEFQTLGTLPEGYAGESATAEIEVHPGGRYLYVSNRGHDSVTTFAVEPGSGQLRWVGATATGGRIPRHFAIDPTGGWCWVANQGSDNVVLYQVDASQGVLTRAKSALTVGSPVCIKYLRVR